MDGSDEMCSKCLKEEKTVCILISVSVIYSQCSVLYRIKAQCVD